MEWDRSYETGDEAVDSQHRRLFTLFDTLEHAEAGGPAEVQQVLGELTEYTAVHFAMEEDLMRREEFPPERVAEHVAEHHDLTGRVRDYVLDYRTGTLDSIRPLTELLREWLRHHVREMDQLLVAHCRERRAGA